MLLIALCLVFKKKNALSSSDQLSRYSKKAHSYVSRTVYVPWRYSNGSKSHKNFLKSFHCDLSNRCCVFTVAAVCSTSGDSRTRYEIRIVLSSFKWLNPSTPWTFIGRRCLRPKSLAFWFHISWLALSSNICLNIGKRLQSNKLSNKYVRSCVIFRYIRLYGNFDVFAFSFHLNFFHWEQLLIVLKSVVTVLFW